MSPKISMELPFSTQNFVRLSKSFPNGIRELKSPDNLHVHFRLTDLTLQVFQRDPAIGCTVTSLLVDLSNASFLGVYSLSCSVLGVGNRAVNKTETCPHLQ